MPLRTSDLILVTRSKVLRWKRKRQSFKYVKGRIGVKKGVADQLGDIFKARWPFSTAQKLMGNVTWAGRRLWSESLKHFSPKIKLACYIETTVSLRLALCLHAVSRAYLFHVASRFAVLIVGFSRNEGSVSEQYRPPPLSLPLFSSSVCCFWSSTHGKKCVSLPGKELHSLLLLTATYTSSATHFSPRVKVPGILWQNWNYQNWDIYEV